MASIDTGRVVIGGLLAGVVMNACDMFWNTVVLKDDMTGIAGKLGMDPATAAAFSTAVPWIVVDFVIGVAVVWNYAAIRPRFGPGPKTAVVSGVTLWLAVCSVFAGLTAIGVYTEQAFIKESFLNLVTVLAASLAGAYFYKE